MKLDTVAASVCAAGVWPVMLISGSTEIPTTALDRPAMPSKLLVMLEFTSDPFSLEILQRNHVFIGEVRWILTYLKIADGFSLVTIPRSCQAVPAGCGHEK